MLSDFIADTLSDVLGDHDDAHLGVADHLLECEFNLTLSSVLGHNQEVGLTILVALTYASQEETSDSCLIADDTDKERSPNLDGLTFLGHLRCISIKLLK